VAHHVSTMVLLNLVFLWIVISPSFAAAQPLKEIRIGSSDITVSNLCTFYARDRKFFEAEGLDAKIIIVRTEAALAALNTGDLEYSTLSTSSIEGTLKGMPLRLIAVTNRQPLLGLLVRKGINSVAELRGKKLSISFLAARFMERLSISSGVMASDQKRRLRF
jgi:ABC-type nitrate/sulfonate/bicarbonate transport system substrate-binding protein